jgi:maleylacetoacetate isomerase
MQLYTFFRSSASFRLRIALALKGIGYEPAYTSLPKMAHKEPAFLKVNPQGLVPALIDDSGQVFTQSLATIEYLDEKYPEPPLIPKDIRERWYVRAIAQIVGCDIHPLNNVRVLKFLKGPFALDPARVDGDWYRHWIAEGFRDLESFLATHRRSGRFCLGDSVTMADICLAPQVFNAERFSCDIAPYPAVRRIYEACLAEPAFQAAHPARQADAF